MSAAIPQDLLQLCLLSAYSRASPEALMSPEEAGGAAGSWAPTGQAHLGGLAAVSEALSCMLASFLGNAGAAERRGEQAAQ